MGEKFLQFPHCELKTPRYLFVGKNEQNSLSELILREHTHQFVSCLTNSFTIVWINNKNETLGILEVMTPQRPREQKKKGKNEVLSTQWRQNVIYVPNFVLTADIPHCEADILILHSLNIKA